MPCINVRDGDGVVIIYDLDNCGNPETGSGHKLVLDSVSEVSWEEQIDEGDEVTERNFAGRKCYSDSGQDEISHVQLNMTMCGINPAVDNFLMGSTSYTDTRDLETQVVGFGRTDLSSTANVAIEVLISLAASECTGGSSATAGWFFPMVKNWRPSGGATLNGSDLVKPQYQGKGYRNPNVFDGSPYDLDRWETILTEGTDGTDGEWYGFYIFDDVDIEDFTVSCEPQALATSS